LGERVRVFRTRVPWERRPPFEVARESLVSVRWVEGNTYYEYPDWVAHDWERRVSGGDESRDSRLQWGECPGR